MVLSNISSNSPEEKRYVSLPVAAGSVTIASTGSSTVTVGGLVMSDVVADESGTSIL